MANANDHPLAIVQRFFDNKWFLPAVAVAIGGLMIWALVRG